ncbi:MAG: hypothetical protein NVSMB16_15450 [Acidimicrobiales bacterium]
MRVVTISAPYGAFGSVIGPRVAERLGIPFIDRAIPMDVATRLSVPESEAMAHDEKVPSGFWRAMALLGTGTIPDGSGPIFDRRPDEEDFRLQTEAVLRDVASSEGGVILGRAAAIVLADRPDALHVRLDGSIERRLAQLTALGDQQAKAHQRYLDKAWAGYVKRFYRRNPADPALYDLILDSTVLSFEICVDLICLAAQQPERR